ncbi:helix-turn-helix transcriptional regulator [Streptomyces niveus]|uniref:Helix-turn-helix transcriptional regulator n=2 Tax=Streptomyces TaxID=1883 RepID=A0A1U9R4T6_STRNV|nr:helix-turn-helix transcriptional regulator [Streptomyces niveus]TXL87021.1 helix-turn-helix transcriptional regulator [Streptomyces sp. IB2014 016-6]
MSVFGVSPAEEEIYRHFLRNPDTSADDIHLLVHTEQDDARRSLDRLRELGLLHPDSSHECVSPADPGVALARLTDARLNALHEELRRVMQARDLVDGLRAEQGSRLPPVQGIEQLEGLSEIRNRIDDLAFFARDEILSVEPYTKLSAENIERSRPLDLRCLRRGVRIRNVVLAAALDDLPTREYLRELVKRGAQIRVAENITERILVYDGRTALVPVDPQNTARGALLAHKSGLVSNIIALFEKIWTQADDLLTVTKEASDAVDGLSEIEQQVLISMCTVGKDEAGARELGISVRTYRRHVADLLQSLGAASRAQGALLARERGWI